MIEKEIDKSALIDVIEYELDWRDKAHKAEINEKNKELLIKEKELLRKKEELLRKKEENAKLKSLLLENDIDF